MEIKIISEKQNPLFKRKEIEMEISDEKIPSKSEILKKISEKISAPEENLIIKKTKTNFGDKNFKVFVFAYDSKEDLEKSEKNKTDSEDSEKSAPAPATEQVPAENSSEEKSVEENKSEENKEEK